jgi:hypothetical protein
MPQVIAEDAVSQTVLDDNGAIVVVPKGAFDFGPPTPAPGALPPGFGGGPPAIGGLAPPGPPAAPPAAALAPVSTQPQLGTPPAAAEPDTTIAPPAPPPPDPTTFAGVTEVGAQAIDAEGAAQQQAAGVQARQQEAAGGTIDARNAAIGNIERAREEQRAKDAEEQAKLEAKLAGAVEEQANYKVDSHRRWNNLTTGQKALTGLGMIMSGLGMALKHQGEQKNPAIAMYESAVAQDVQDQMAERDRLGDKAKAAGTAADRFRSISSDKVAQYNLQMASEMERAARDLEAQSQKFGAEQTKANAAIGAAQFRERKAEYLGGAMDRERQRKMEERRLGLEGGRLALDKQRFSLDIAQFGEQNRRFDKQMELEGQKMALDAARLDAAGQKDQAAAMRAAAKEQRELAIGGVPTVSGVGKDGRPIVRFEPLRNADGSIFQAPDSTAAREIREQKEATDVVTHFIDETIRLIEENGGSSDVLKSDVWQKIQSNKGMIQNKLRIAYKMGALDKGALQQMEVLLGGANPTSFVYDATPGMRQARTQVVESFNSTLGANGYDSRYEIPEFTSAGIHEQVKNTPEGDLLKTAEKRDRRGVGEFAGMDAQMQAIGDITQGVDPGVARGQAEVPPEARQAILGLVSAAKVGSPEARKALSILARDPNPAVRQMAITSAAATGITLQEAR